MAKTVRQKEINFLAVLTGRAGKKKINPRMFILPGVLLIIVVAGLGVFGLTQMSINQVKDESSAIREYLNSSEVNRQLNEAESLEAQASNMSWLAESVASPMDNLSTYPDMTSEHYAKIFEYAGVNIELSTMSFDRSTGLLSFTATSDYVFSVSTFISQLRVSGLFTDVSYSGYSGNAGSSQLATSTSRYTSSDSTYDESSTYTAPSYAFSVECSVKPPDPVSESEPEETTGEEG